MEEFKDEYYEQFTKEQLIRSCKMHKKVVNHLRANIDERDAVLQKIMKFIGADYWVGLDKKIGQFFENSGDKAKLKRRVNELEKENEYLKSLLGVNYESNK